MKYPCGIEINGSCWTILQKLHNLFLNLVLLLVSTMLCAMELHNSVKTVKKGSFYLVVGCFFDHTGHTSIRSSGTLRERSELFALFKIKRGHKCIHLYIFLFCLFLSDFYYFTYLPQP